ncbi:hypothetical protein D3C75_1173450 [compost metagenome]
MKDIGFAGSMNALLTLCAEFRGCLFTAPQLPYPAHELKSLHQTLPFNLPVQSAIQADKLVLRPLLYILLHLFFYLR